MQSLLLFIHHIVILIDGSFFFFFLFLFLFFSFASGKCAFTLNAIRYSFSLSVIRNSASGSLVFFLLIFNLISLHLIKMFSSFLSSFSFLFSLFFFLSFFLFFFSLVRVLALALVRLVSPEVGRTCVSNVLSARHGNR